jgi:hypothetical protein
MDAVVVDAKEDLSRVVDLVARGVEMFEEAGIIIAAYLKENPEGVMDVCGATGLDARLVRRFEEIGLHKIIPEVLISTEEGVRRLATCSYREQVYYLREENPVQLLVEGGNTLNVQVSAMTAEQARQTFCRKGVRTLAEQRAWLAARNRAAELEAVRTQACLTEAPYTIRGRKIIFRAGCELGVKQLRGLLAEVAA